MNPVSGFIIICLIIVLGYGIGLLNYLNDFEPDKCEMTYMFEYPQYVRISNKADKLFPKYGLYAYSEGGLTSRARKMYFDGIPVLFIPGNAGSYKQVRSLSSVALRKALNSRTQFHFDYFTVDFSDELSGLYGPLLYDQLNYVNRSLYRIFELYHERKDKPTSIVLIGHSMGGVIARNLLSIVPDPNLISTLIALAAPLKRAPIELDYHMHNFYADSKWKTPETVNTTVISLSGGYNDLLMPTYLTQIQNNKSLSVVTTNIPRCWIQSNHIQIIWCKQVVLAINRALFDSVDPKTKQISLNSTYRQMAFKQYLIDDTGTKVQDYDKYFAVIKLDYRGQWIENLLRQYSAQFLNGLKETHWHMVRLTSLPAHEMLTVLAINLEVVDWVFACNANFPRGSSRVCTEGVHLTHLSKIWPSVKYKRRFFEINLNELRKNHSELTHVAFRGLPTNEPVVFHVDVHNSAERRITVDLPKWWLPTKQVILERTPEKALHYELILPQLQHIIQSYELFVEPINCVTNYHHASASLIVPWGNQNHHAFFTNTEKDSLKVRLHSSKPPYWNDTQSVVIKLTLEPSCTYKVSIKPSILGMLGQMARLYTPLLLTNIAAIVLLVLKYQLRSLKDGHCSIIFVAIKEGVKPYYILPFAKILPKVFSAVKLFDFLPKTDTSYIIEDGMDFIALAPLLFTCSVGIVWLLAITFSISLITLESTAHKLALKFLARTVSFNVAWSDYLLSALHKVPFIVAASLVFICFSTCGGLALCLGTVFYFLKLTQMSQDYVEEVVWFVIKKVASSFKRMLSKKKTNANENTEKRYKELKDSDQAVENMGTITNEDNNRNKCITNKVEDIDDEKQNGTISDSENRAEILAVENIDNKVNSEKSIKVRKRTEKISNENTDKKGQDIDENLQSNSDSGNDKENVKHENITQKDGIQKKTGKENQLSSGYNSIFFHLTLFFLWCIITLINIPAVLTWAHNFKFSKTLSPDDSFVPGLALSLCALPLWQFEFPKTDRKWIRGLEIFVMVIAVVSIIFATISVYRLNYLLSLTIVAITLHQMFAPKTDDYIEPIDHDVNDKTRDKYEDIKTKIE